MGNMESTVLIISSLKRFELMIKSSPNFSNQNSVGTGKYALKIVAGQAYNPLNYNRW